MLQSERSRASDIQRSRMVKKWLFWFRFIVIVRRAHQSSPLPRCPCGCRTGPGGWTSSCPWRRSRRRWRESCAEDSGYEIIRFFSKQIEWSLWFLLCHHVREGAHVTDPVERKWHIYYAIYCIFPVRKSIWWHGGSPHHTGRGAGVMVRVADEPDRLRGVTSCHFLLDGNLLPFEMETPVKSWPKGRQHERGNKSNQS